MAEPSNTRSQPNSNSARKTTDDSLDDLARKALQIAESSEDADEMFDAFRLYQAVDRQKQKAAAKTRSLGALQVAQIIAPYTAIIALLVSVGTLAFQFWQVRTTETDKERNAERTEWREALRNLSMKDDSAVFSGALGMQTFFASPQYAVQSRSSVVALLPLLGDGSEFDTVWEGILEQTDPHNQFDLVSIDRSIVAEEDLLFAEVTGGKFPNERAREKAFVEFIVDPDRPERGWTNPSKASTPESVADSSAKSSDTHAVNEFAWDREHNPVKRAKAGSWKLDSISSGLRYVCLKKQLKPNNVDWTGVILLNAKLDGLDFSGANLSRSLIHYSSFANANFDDAHLDGTMFTEVREFAGSSWTNVHWWDAELMSCNLAHYLLTKYPPKDPSAQAKARTSVDSCE